MDKNNFGDFDIKENETFEPATQGNKGSNKGNKNKTNKQGNNNKKNNIILVLVLVAAGIVIAVALYNIIGIKSEDIANSQDYASLQSYTTDAEGANSAAAEGSLKSMDFKKLKELNQDITGWITIPGTTIDYPLVQKDNYYYLNKNALKNDNRGGAIFIDETNAGDFTDENTIIYGHNMNDGSMFAPLHKYESEEFLKANNQVIITTPANTYKYKIFAAYDTSDISDTYTTAFNEGEYAKYLEKMKSYAPYATDVAVSADKNIITLSTCIKDQDTRRYVIQAVLEEQTSN